MPGIQTGNVVTVTIKGQAFNQQIQFGLTYICGVSFSDVDVSTSLNTILTAIKPAGPSDLVTPYLTLLPAQYTANFLYAQVIYPTRSAYVSQGLSSAPGTNVNPATAANDSTAITLRTAFAGRKQVATKKIGPIGDGTRTGGNMTTAYQILLAGFALQLQNTLSFGVNPGTLLPCIYHKATPGQYDLITASLIGVTARVHRRRTVGIGR